VFDLLVESAQGFVVLIFVHRTSWVKTSVSHRLGTFAPSTFASDRQVAWPSVQHRLGTGPRVIGDLMTRTLAPSTSGTRTGRLAQALGMMSDAVLRMSELEAEVTVESRLVRMVANLVDEVEEEESSEDEESAFEGDRHH